MMDDPIPPHTYPARPSETHTVPVHYQPAQPAAVHIVDLDTGAAVCGYNTSGPGWTLAAMAINVCCLDCIMVYQQHRLAEKRARWEAGEPIQEPEPDLWGADGAERDPDATTQGRRTRK